MDYKPIQVASNYDVRGPKAPRIVFTPHGIVVAKPDAAISYLPRVAFGSNDALAILDGCGLGGWRSNP